jgi:hypothetical protein
MKQKTIHISFSKDDIDLYNELMRESCLSYVPASAIIRMYVRKGMQNKEKQLQPKQYENYSNIKFLL